MPLIFSYGTLPQKDVQLSTFGKRHSSPGLTAAEWS